MRDDLPRMQVRLLGEVAVATDDGVVHRLAGAQPRLCFALLVLERPHGIGKAELAHHLWGDAIPAHWEGAVRGVIAKVRAFLVAAGLEPGLTGNLGRWHLELPLGATVDLEEAAKVVAEAAAQPVGAAWAAPQRAADLLVGDLVPGTAGEWIEGHRRSADALRRRALHAAGRAAVAGGRPVDALAPAERLVALDPFDERARRLLAQAHFEEGDRRAALAVLGDLRRLLADELGVRPEPETENLERRIRADVDEPLPEVGTRPRTVVRAPLPAPPPGTLVGRAHQIGCLEAEWDAVERGGRLRLVTVEGEAGAGKTRLALELCRLAGAAGARVLWGRCGPDQGVAYEPVLEALGRALADDHDLLDALGHHAAELGSLLPELDLVTAAGATFGDAGGAAARTRLFRAVGAAALAVAGAPAVWVLDDLHWADDDTLAMLRHLVDTAAGAPLLVLVTTRPPPGPVNQLLAHLTRLVPTTTLALPGLDTPEVAALLDEAGVVGGDDLAAVVQERTGGNPFFVGQVVALADEAGHLDPLAVPVALRIWLERRVAALPPEVSGVLALAAVLGDDLDLETLVACSALGEEVLLDACEQLAWGRLLGDVTEAGELAFPHALVRDAVYEGCKPARRAFLHRRVASTLEAAGAPPARLAHHLGRAGPGSRLAAHAASLAAGHEAYGQAAWESATVAFRAAADLGGGGTRERGRALVGLGRALRADGRRSEARDALEEAIAVGRATNDPRLLGEAALALVGGGARGVAEDLPDEARAALLSEALQGLGEADDDLAVALTGELALALLLTERHAERAALATAGLERARRRGDPALLGPALLWARLAHLLPEDAEVRLAEVAELLALPEAVRPPELTVGGLVSLHEDLLLTGDRPAARRALAEAAAVVERYHHPYWQWVVATWGVLGQIIDGRLDEAEAAAFGALGLQPNHPEAMACLGVELVDIRLHQGRSGEVIDLLADAADANPQIPAYRAVLALCLAQAGRLDDAGAPFSFFAADGFASIPLDTNRLLTLGVLADVAATLGDQAAAAALVELLAPHERRQVVLNCFAGGGAWWGPVARQLARLAALLGSSADAARWQAIADEEAARMAAV